MKVVEDGGLKTSAVDQSSSSAVEGSSAPSSETVVRVKCLLFDGLLALYANGTTSPHHLTAPSFTVPLQPHVPSGRQSHGTAGPVTVGEFVEDVLHRAHRKWPSVFAPYFSAAQRRNVADTNESDGVGDGESADGRPRPGGRERDGASSVATQGNTAILGVEVSALVDSLSVEHQFAPRHGSTTGASSCRTSSPIDVDVAVNEHDPFHFFLPTTQHNRDTAVTSPSSTTVIVHFVFCSKVREDLGTRISPFLSQSEGDRASRNLGRGDPGQQELAAVLVPHPPPSSSAASSREGTPMSVHAEDDTEVDSPPARQPTTTVLQQRLPPRPPQGHAGSQQSTGVRSRRHRLGASSSVDSLDAEALAQEKESTASSGDLMNSPDEPAVASLSTEARGSLSPFSPPRCGPGAKTPGTCSRPIPAVANEEAATTALAGVMESASLFANSPSRSSRVSKKTVHQRKQDQKEEEEQFLTHFDENFEVKVEVLRSKHKSIRFALCTEERKLRRLLNTQLNEGMQQIVQQELMDTEKYEQLLEEEIEREKEKQRQQREERERETKSPQRGMDASVEQTDDTKCCDGERSPSPPPAEAEASDDEGCPCSTGSSVPDGALSPTVSLTANPTAGIEDDASSSQKNAPSSPPTLSFGHTATERSALRQLDSQQHLRRVELSKSEADGRQRMMEDHFLELKRFELRREKYFIDEEKKVVADEGETRIQIGSQFERKLQMYRRTFESALKRLH